MSSPLLDDSIIFALVTDHALISLAKSEWRLESEVDTDE